MHDRKSAQVVQEYLPPLTKKRQIAHVDIMFLGTKKYFVVLVNPTNMAFTIPIVNISLKAVKRCVDAVKSAIATRGGTIHALVHNSEEAITRAPSLRRSSFKRQISKARGFSRVFDTGVKRYSA